ncbi:MAG: PAS domain S-box protein [Myxococcales bacterium]|nr:PAS domain S-box protein [Myxococcales bacterium]
MHELQVHQVELEMQNEELRAARQETEDMLLRFTQLFESAPMGYFVVSSEGTVHQANLSAARLLGAEPWAVVGRRLAVFVEPERRQAFADFLARVATAQAREQEACDVLVGRPDAPPRDVHLVGSVLEGSAPALLVVAEDITLRKRAEAAIRDECRRKDLLIAKLRGLGRDMETACAPADPASPWPGAGATRESDGR